MNGQQLQPGVYVYAIDLTGDEAKFITGDITLIR